MTVVRTKFHIPRTAGLTFVRERFLRESLAPLTVIHGPPGYGKTTVALQMIESVAGDTCWLSLDPFDNDPRGFWLYFIAAIQTQLPEVGRKSVGMLQAESGSDVIGPVRALLSDLETLERSRPLQLVLDDFHHLTNPEILNTFNAFLDFQPQFLKLILTSRTQPPLRLASRKSKGLCEDVRAEELRLTEAESIYFLQTWRKISLPNEALAAIIQQFEGWIAGLQLLAVSLNAQRPLSGWTLQQSDATQDIYGLMLEEVVADLPDDIRDLVVKTAFLPRFTADLIDYVLMRSGADPILHRLLSLNLFVIPLEGQGGWFRYHDLFRAMLQDRFPLDRDTLSGLQTRAGEWCESNGWVMDAIDHFLLAAQWPQMLRLISIHSLTWLREGQNQTLRRAIQNIPSEVMDQHALLLCLKVWIAPDQEKYMSGAESVEKALALISPGENGTLDEPHLGCLIYTLKAMIARLQGRWHETIEHSRRALQYADVSDMPLRWRSYLTLGAHAYLQGDLPEARSLLWNAVNFALAEQHAYGIAQTSGYLSEVLYQSGQLDDAWRMALHVRESLETTDFVHSSLAAWRFIGVVDLHRERNELDACRSLLTQLNALRSLDSCEFLQHLIILLRSWTFAISRRDLALAKTTLDEIESLQFRMRFPSVFASGTLAGMRARLAWLQNDKTQCMHWLNQNERILRNRNFLFEQDVLTAVRILALLDRDEEALALSQRLAEASRLRGGQLTWSKCRLWQSIIWERMSSHEASVEALISVFDTLKAEGYVSVFLDEGPVIIPVLKACLSHPQYGSFAHRLLQKLVPSLDGAETHPLSPREMQMMAFVKGGLTDKEIARELNISPGTVKTHLRNIYRKLEVNGRVQALARLALLQGKFDLAVHSENSLEG